MIHDLKPEYFALPLRDYRLTFDDGLFSQYYYQPLLADQPGGLTFFVATAFVRPGPARPRFAGRYLEHLKSGVYSRRAFIEGRLDDFMTVDEVGVLADQPGVRIGAHSHFHDVVLTDVHPRKPKAPSPWKTERFREVPEALRRGLSIRSRLAFQGFDYRRRGPEPAVGGPLAGVHPGGHRALPGVVSAAPGPGPGELLLPVQRVLAAAARDPAVLRLPGVFCIAGAARPEPDPPPRHRPADRGGRGTRRRPQVKAASPSQGSR